MTTGLSLGTIIQSTVGFQDTSGTQAPPLPVVDERDREWDEPLPDGSRPPATNGQRAREDMRWRSAKVNAALGSEVRKLEGFEAPLALPLTAQHLAPTPPAVCASDAPTVTAGRLGPIAG